MAEGSKQKGANYADDEDIALCQAWIVMNEDPIIENSQSKQGSEDNKELEISLHEHQRFVHQILILQDAKRMYFEREQKAFLLDHYWNVVLQAHKWQPFEGYQSSSFVNTSPIGVSTPLDEDLSMETIPKTQEFMQTSNPC
ncbi:unnamed protein product [Prunus armeniaca]|uniref:No apical meristem-associated C-terminal domain-containing protein n=1 Tax=Prunus armeniaca TaxID=36596 RepID=A0A6J5TX39_PRUAR|nr:unnamed protein product [Prunus armeniaca]